MNIAGFQKLTVIDYPGHIAATVFTQGCNFRCPFCHNPELLTTDFNGSDFKEDLFFEFLKSRKGKLDGVCITGGEPTLQPDLLNFLKKIKKLDFLVKLDTNGTRPDVVKRAIEEGLVDFIAMDIKSSLKGYAKTCGGSVDLDRIKLSVELIKNSRVPYEFRTTVVPSLHIEKDFKEIASWLGEIKRYALQEFQDSGKILNRDLTKKAKRKKVDLNQIKAIMDKVAEKVEVRQ